jgi:hypothetical protein
VRGGNLNAGKTIMRDNDRLKETKEIISELTIPTERPPLVGEFSANFSGYRMPCSQRDVSLRPYYLFLCFSVE